MAKDKKKQFRLEYYDDIAYNRDDAFVQEVGESGLMQYFNQSDVGWSDDVSYALGILYNHTSMPKHNPRTVEHIHPGSKRTPQKIFKDLQNFYNCACKRLEAAGVNIIHNPSFERAPNYYDLEALADRHLI